MAKRKESKRPKGRAVRKVERKQPDISAQLEQLTALIAGMAQAPRAEEMPRAATRRRTEHEMLQSEMGLARAKNREWRDMETLMAKIGHLEAFRDKVEWELSEIKKALGL